MKITDFGNYKEFYMNGDKVKIVHDEEWIEIHKNDRYLTSFSNIEDFYFFINALTEIAKKIKEGDKVEENKDNIK